MSKGGYSIRVSLPNENLVRNYTNLNNKDLMIRYSNNETSLHSSLLSRNLYANDESTDVSVRSIESKQSIYSPTNSNDELNTTSNNTKKVTEAAFRHQNRTTETIQKYIAPFTNIQALDLSYNKLSSLPYGLPSSLIAIDLSHNVFTSFKSFHHHYHHHQHHYLVELRIANNNITSTLGLTNITSLEYLDISYNKITRIEGLGIITIIIIVIVIIITIIIIRNFDQFESVLITRQ